MQPRQLARVVAGLRVGLGAALMIAPARAAGGWVGAAADTPAGRVLAFAVGARDVAVGGGTLLALQRGTGARDWLRASVAADAADCFATLRARRSLPPLPAAGVAVMAGSAALLSLWLEREID
jgi:hypothetical protein